MQLLHLTYSFLLLLTVAFEALSLTINFDINIEGGKKDGGGRGHRGGSYGGGGYDNGDYDSGYKKESYYGGYKKPSYQPSYKPSYQPSYPKKRMPYMKPQHYEGYSCNNPYHHHHYSSLPTSTYGYGSYGPRNYYQREYSHDYMPKYKKGGYY